MKRKMEISELIFKVISYVLLIILAVCCIYPFIYAISSSFSVTSGVDGGKVVLWPVGFQTEAYRYVLSNNTFWISYANTLFMAFVGTLWCMLYTMMGAYALSKKRLMGRRAFNFFLVFTMWFSAGVVPTYLNYLTTGDVLASILAPGSTHSQALYDQKWLIIIAMGMNAQNVILLRNAFEGVPAEIEEAARIDGATEMQVLFKVYIPMSKATIAGTNKVLEMIAKRKGLNFNLNINTGGGNSGVWWLDMLQAAIGVASAVAEKRAQEETEVQRYEAETDVLCKQVDARIAFCRQVFKRIEEIISVSNELETRCVNALKKLETIINVFDVENQVHLSYYQTVGILMKGISELSKVEILDSKDQLSQSDQQYIIRSRQLLTETL